MSNLANMVRDDLGRFMKNLDGIKPELRAAETARIMIVRRTRAGLDRHGNRFAPYRPRTIEIRRRKGQSASPVTLTDSGAMLESLITRAPAGHQQYTVHGGRTVRRAEIVTADKDNEKKLRIHTRGTRRMAQRDITGLTEREQRALHNQFRADVDRAVPSKGSGRIRINIFSPL